MKTKVKDHTHPDYVFEGVKYPSVTQILSVIAKPYLITWANKLGREGKTVNQVTQPSMLAGTLTHALIEKDITRGEEAAAYLNEIYPIEDEIEQSICDDAMHCWSLYTLFKDFYKPTYLAREVTLISRELGFAGTIDAVASIDNELYIIDWKTSDKAYDEYYLQLYAYYALWNKIMEVPVDKVALALLPKKADNFEFHVVSVDKIEHLQDTFEAAKTLHQYQALKRNLF